MQQQIIQQQINSIEDEKQIRMSERKLSLRPAQSKNNLIMIKTCLNPIIRYGHWKESENLKYKQFLRENYFIIKNGLLRYHYRIFLKMALRIGTRDAVQCKSHHQKMLDKYNNCIQNLVFSPEPNEIGKLMNIFPKSLPLYKQKEFLQGIKKVETSQQIPWLMAKVNHKIVIVLDERFISSFQQKIA